MVNAPSRTSSFRITLPTDLVRYLIDTNNTQHSIPEICTGMICHMVNQMVQEAAAKQEEENLLAPGEKDRKCWL